MAGKEVSVLIGGRAGDGINSAGAVIAHFLNHLGYVPEVTTLASSAVLKNRLGFTAMQWILYLHSTRRRFLGIMRGSMKGR
jgi:hypothetical protein